MSDVADEVRQLDIAIKGVLGKLVGEAWLVRDVGIGCIGIRVFRKCAKTAFRSIILGTDFVFQGSSCRTSPMNFVCGYCHQASLGAERRQRCTHLGSLLEMRGGSEALTFDAMVFGASWHAFKQAVHGTEGKPSCVRLLHGLLPHLFLGSVWMLASGCMEYRARHSSEDNPITGAGIVCGHDRCWRPQCGRLNGNKMFLTF